LLIYSFSEIFRIYINLSANNFFSEISSEFKKVLAISQTFSDVISKSLIACLLNLSLDSLILGISVFQEFRDIEELSLFFKVSFLGKFIGQLYIDENELDEFIIN
jgi:hypothetical protein